MADYEQTKNSRSEYRQHRQQKNNKMNRLLNYLIAFVVVLIGITSYIIFFTGDDKAVEKEPVEQPADKDVNTNDISEENHETNDNAQNETNEVDEPDVSDSDQQTEGTSEENDATNVTTSSTDPLVDEVVVNPNWQPTKTTQTGPHTSVFQGGHIDYEEKLATVFAVVPLEQANSILWNIGNNGSADTAIAVVSSNDKTEKYRVSIEWVANEGWKPVKLEKLNTIEGSW
ncbi:YrrS family protein [Metasolibacillus meyeri]|uniref:YrrS family protein n=1 Tax=Metasolibacillus meyeri TaxID=1071052 RepID=UPI000D2FA82B|nr:YrrS family protein [Metasolibacillus meyeri]